MEESQASPIKHPYVYVDSKGNTYTEEGEDITVKLATDKTKGEQKHGTP